MRTDPADGLAALEIGVGGGGFCERIRPVDLDAQAPGGDVVDEPTDHRLRTGRRDLRAEEHAGE